MSDGTADGAGAVGDGTAGAARAGGEAAPPLRRRGERMRQAVLAVTVDLLAAEGLPGTTMASVSRAAGVHETSLYRRWGTREHLIQDALTTHTDEALPLPDTGSVRQDLNTFLAALCDFLRTAHGSALLHLGAAPGGSGSDEARRAFWTSRLDRAETMIQRGVARGELAPGTDARLLAEAVAAPLFSRVLLTGGPVDHAFARGLVDLALDGAAPRENRAQG